MFLAFNISQSSYGPFLADTLVDGVIGGVALQFATGYVVAFPVYQTGTLITTGTVGAGFIPGLIVVAAIVAAIGYRCKNADKNVSAEYALKK